MPGRVPRRSPVVSQFRSGSDPLETPRLAGRLAKCLAAELRPPRLLDLASQSRSHSCLTVAPVVSPSHGPWLRHARCQAHASIPRSWARFLSRYAVALDTPSSWA